jgi:hypothetical protein
VKAMKREGPTAHGLEPMATAAAGMAGGIQGAATKDVRGSGLCSCAGVVAGSLVGITLLLGAPPGFRLAARYGVMCMCVQRTRGRGGSHGVPHLCACFDVVYPVPLPLPEVPACTSPQGHDVRFQARGRHVWLL